MGLPAAHIHHAGSDWERAAAGTSGPDWSGLLRQGRAGCVRAGLDRMLLPGTQGPEPGTEPEARADRRVRLAAFRSRSGRLGRALHSFRSSTNARSMMSMQYRTPARLGRPLSAIGQGCWQIGADWGEVTDDSAHAVLDAALAAVVTYFASAVGSCDGRCGLPSGAIHTP